MTESITKPKSQANVKKAISLGKELMKKEGITKAEVSREIFGLIKEEDREVVAQVFVEACGLTEKGAMTYYYNARRKLK